MIAGPKETAAVLPSVPSDKPGPAGQPDWMATATGTVVDRLVKRPDKAGPAANAGPSPVAAGPDRITMASR